MSILDTFYILFKTDADKAAADIADVDKASDRAEHGLKKMDLAARAVGTSFVNMALGLAAPIAAIASFGGAIAIVQNRIQEIGTISDDALKLRTSPQEYDAFTRAVRAAGGEMAAAQANLTTFAEKLNDAAARASGPNAKNFAKWGIAFRDAGGEAVGAVDGILALAKSLENVSRAEALGRLKKLGIEDADTIDFLLQGKKAIVERMDAEKAAGVVTDRQIELEGQYQSAVGKTRNMLDSMAGTLTELLLPSMIRAYEGFNKFFGWILDNGTLVKGFFIGLATVVTVTMLPALTSMAAAAWAAIAPLLVLAAPFLAIAAAITAVSVAFALAYEDVWAFIEGQPSALGELVAKYEWVAKAVEIIGNAWKSLSPILDREIAHAKATWDTFVSLFMRASEIIATGLKAWVTMIAEIYGPMFEAVSDMWKAIGDLVKVGMEEIVKYIFDGWSNSTAPVTDAVSEMTNAFKPLKDDVAAVVNAIPEVFRVMAGIVKEIWADMVGFLTGKIEGITTAVRSITARIAGTAPPSGPVAGGDRAGALMGAEAGKFLLNRAGGFPAAGVSPNGQAVANTNNVTVGPVTVNTQATDAKGVAAAVRGELQNQLRTTSAQFDDGVAK